MNILHLITSLDNGGAEKLLVDILENTFEKERYYLCIVNNVYSTDYRNRTEKLLGDRAIFLMRKEGSRDPAFVVKLNKIIKERKIEIIHAHNEFSKKLAIILKVLNPKIKIVYTVHDTKIVKRYGWLQKNITRVFINQYIAISKSVEEEILCLFKGKNKNINMIYNGIDVKTYSNSHPQLMKEKVKICCLARYNVKKKGQDILIEAINIIVNRFGCTNVECDFFGKVHNDSELKQLKELIDSNSLSEYISLNGVYTDIPKLLSMYDILVLPSRNEGLGLVLLEAMSAEVLTVAAALEGPREVIIQDGLCGYLFEPDNAENLAEKLMHAITSLGSEEVRSIKERAKRRVEENFEIQSMVKDYEKVYLKAI